MRSEERGASVRRNERGRGKGKREGTKETEDSGDTKERGRGKGRVLRRLRILGVPRKGERAWVGRSGSSFFVLRF